MFLRERKEGGKEGDTANTQKVRRREKQVRDVERQTDLDWETGYLDSGCPW